MADEPATPPNVSASPLRSSYVDFATRSILSTVEIDGEWWIDTVRVRAEHRGKRIASTLLAEALADADRTNTALRLRVHPNTMDPNALTYEQLVDWYQRHGFTLDKDEMHMSRPPHP